MPESRARRRASLFAFWERRLSASFSQFFICIFVLTLISEPLVSGSVTKIGLFSYKSCVPDIVGAAGSGLNVFYFLPGDPPFLLGGNLVASSHCTSTSCYRALLILSILSAKSVSNWWYLSFRTRVSRATSVSMKSWFAMISLISLCSAAGIATLA